MKPLSPQSLIRTLLRWLQTLDRGLEHVERSALIVGILAMSGMAVVNVISRNLFGSSLAFSEEVNQILIILVTFSGVGYAARQGRHIRMTALYDQLPETPRRWMMVFITAVTAAILFVLTWYASLYVIQTADIGGVTPALGIPQWTIYVVVPIGLGVGALQFLLTAVRNMVADEVWLSLSLPERAAGDPDEEAHI